MRSEVEMMKLIRETAEQDERVRAVYMNGSRTNSLAPKDEYQDYDVVYVVTEVSSFLNDRAWIDRFGKRVMMQEPDLLDYERGMEVDLTKSYIYLMLFKDGNRLDLRLQTIEAMQETYGDESLTIPIIDKDELFPMIPKATDRDYHVPKPLEADFTCCVNNFWWCLQNVAKGLARNEHAYANGMFEGVVRVDLNQMVDWWIGCQYDFGVSTGKYGKYTPLYLPESLQKQYEKTYATGNSTEMWKAIYQAIQLFRQLAQEVAEQLDFTYEIEDDRNMTSYLKSVQLKTGSF
ncbi:aminoglycoside 6-adenylyltransferase [Alkalihalobacillus xiaoxiensis]|uniref:Aminoglycoside 6-adenylyltransferase n=1 Tax=Shouchella xiaoxiensis TaxID=766895 RepID=A0ABS2SR05_9BACI|nr:aminoglycoside 6-adenylyltransferase [Shouchella xiaoxiensis]